MDSMNSGSTLISVIISGNELICSNTGDSRAILGSFNKNWKISNLSTDHTPNNEFEKKRILKLGGRVEKAKGRNSGPLRLYLKDSLEPGLGVSRAFGDRIAQLAGLIHTPDIMT